MTSTSPAASDRYRRLAHDFTVTVGAVPDDRWEAASPCVGWTVADVVDHVVSTQRDHLVRMGFDAGAERLGADRDAWPDVRDAVLRALDEPTTAGHVFEGFFGPTTFAESIDTFYSGDLVVHRWDVARGAGLGDHEPIDPGEIERVRAALAHTGPALRSAGIFGPEVDVGPDATATDRFVAWTGRDPMR